MVTTDSDEEKRREITGVYPQSLQDPKMGGSRLAKMADEEEELGTSGHEVEHCGCRYWADCPPRGGWVSRGLAPFRRRRSYRLKVGRVRCSSSDAAVRGSPPVAAHHAVAR